MCIGLYLVPSVAALAAGFPTKVLPEESSVMMRFISKLNRSLMVPCGRIGKL